MGTNAEILERTASRSPGSIGYSLAGGGRGKMMFRVEFAQRDNAIVDLIGDVRPKGDGKLRRFHPMSHPEDASMFCERIAEIRGISWEAELGSITGGIGNSLATYGQYHYYEIEAEFRPLPYAIIDDVKIQALGVSWTDWYGATVLGYRTTEWQRYTDFSVMDATELLTADQGTMYMASKNANIMPPPNTPNDPHGAQFGGRPRIKIPGDKLTVDWYAVPYSYVSHPKSNLRRYKYTLSAEDWAGYQSGTLLYEGFTVTERTTPVFPVIETVDNATVVSQEKVCNLRLQFGLRQVAVAGGPANSGMKLFKAPWNCAPLFQFSGKWYSVINVAPVMPGDANAPNDQTRWFPTYQAIQSFDCLFADPSLNP